MKKRIIALLAVLFGVLATTASGHPGLDGQNSYTGGSHVLGGWHHYPDSYRADQTNITIRYNATANQQSGGTQLAENTFDTNPNAIYSRQWRTVIQNSAADIGNREYAQIQFPTVEGPCQIAGASSWPPPTPSGLFYSHSIYECVANYNSLGMGACGGQWAGCGAIGWYYCCGNDAAGVPYSDHAYAGVAWINAGGTAGPDHEWDEFGQDSTTYRGNGQCCKVSLSMTQVVVHEALGHGLNASHLDSTNTAMNSVLCNWNWVTNQMNGSTCINDMNGHISGDINGPHQHNDGGWSNTTRAVPLKHTDLAARTDSDEYQPYALDAGMPGVEVIVVAKKDRADMAKKIKEKKVKVKDVIYVTPSDVPPTAIYAGPTIMSGLDRLIDG